MSVKIESYRLSEFIKLDHPVEHLDLIAFDNTDPSRLTSLEFASCPGLEHVISLDASRLGLTGDDVYSMVLSPYLRKIRWLSLAGNYRVDEFAVRGICSAIKRGWYDLDWLDLRGNSFDATPYLEDGGFEIEPGQEDIWRVPQITRQLAKKYGLQKWMTLGYPLEDEGWKYIPVREYPPARIVKKPGDKEEPVR